jgi:prepilin peptidase CpaA
MILALDLARLCFFPALMAFAAVSDLLTMTISNRVSLLLVAGFAALAAGGGMPLAEIASHGGAGLLVLVAAFGCFAMGWIGGGDAKVASAAALWLGFPHLMEFLLYASLFGGALTLLLIQFRHVPLPLALGRQEWLQRLHTKDGDIPYGIALALGALAVYPDTSWIKAIDLAHLAL